MKRKKRKPRLLRTFEAKRETTAYGFHEWIVEIPDMLSPWEPLMCHDGLTRRWYLHPNTKRIWIELWSHRVPHSAEVKCSDDWWGDLFVDGELTGVYGRLFTELRDLLTALRRKSVYVRLMVKA